MMQKTFFLILYAWLIAFLPVCMAAVPAPIARLDKTLEQTKMVWQVDRTEPLEKTVKSPSVSGGWRISLSRPAEQVETGRPVPPRNTAEIILVPADPGRKAEDIRKLLTWKQSPSELYSVIAYPGNAEGYFFFSKSDIILLNWLKQTYHLQGGDPLEQIYAKMLSVQDLKQSSALAASVFLPPYGDKVIPLVCKSMGIALADGVSVAPHLSVLKAIGTKAAADELMRSWHSGLPRILEDLPGVIGKPPWNNHFKALYLDMMNKHQGVAAGLNAAVTFHWEKEFLPHVRKIKSEPGSLQEFFLLSHAERFFRTGKPANPEQAAVRDIFLLSMRSGDMANTPRIVNLATQSAASELKFKEDVRKRVTPAMNILIKSKDIDCAVAGALELAVFSAPEREYSREYVNRINRCGHDILKVMPRSDVRRILSLLAKHVADEKEASVFRRLLSTYPRY